MNAGMRTTPLVRPWFLIFAVWLALVTVAAANVVHYGRAWL